MSSSAETVRDPEVLQKAAPARRKSRKTARSVLIADKIADWVIRIGGIGVIVAVFGIMLFLAEVIVPLFTGGNLESRTNVPVARLEGRVLTSVVDEYRTLAIKLDDGGHVTAFHLASGDEIEAPDLPLADTAPTAFGRTPQGGDIALGFADGTLRFGKIGFAVDFVEAEARPANLRRLGASDDFTDGTYVYTAIPTGQIRRTAIVATLGEPQKVAEGAAAITAIDYRIGGPAERPTRSFVTVDERGIGRLSRAETRRNMMTGQDRTAITTADLPGLPDGVRIAVALINNEADQAYFADAAGTVYRFNAGNFNSPTLAETVDLAPGDARLTSLAFLIGEQSLVVGRSDGSVDIYFRLPAPGSNQGDGFALKRAHQLDPQTSEIVAIAVGQRGKTFATAGAGGEIWLRHGTSAQVLLTLAPEGTPARYRSVAMAPRDNAVIAVAEDGKAYAWNFAVPHPETTLQTIFGKVWYEGYPEPGYTWQSSAGTDAFEPKFSLIPLIFGTLKATFYSMLFAVPIALGAAIFTSEFMSPRLRAVIKPTMELMASMPSVVLGFIAAIVMAPIIETWIGAIVIGFVAVPAGLILAACAWQATPGVFQRKYGSTPRFAAMLLTLIAFSYLTVLATPALERALFEGSFKAWTTGTVGVGTPFTTLVLIPFAFAAVWFGSGTLFIDRIMNTYRTANPGRAGIAYLVRWIATFVVAIVVSLVIAGVLDGLGLDPRGGVIDTYVQRNTLIVGLAMGFAVIPIIYTVSEDALNAVPGSLRAASLACGATTWQTTIKVVVPTAMSGIFAAAMVGMGRAVGETMIVVMAAGNTPILEWNVFAGLRALSANIAVELPEAVKDSTLYRMLFLAALTLFVMTFIVNTIAEMVRLRFRKRTASL